MINLFEMEDCPSPRLVWIEKHGFLTHHAPHCGEDPWMAIIPMDDHKGNISDIMAEWCGLYEEMDRIGYGRTEQDAINDCAVRMGIKLWNEEGA